MKLTTAKLLSLAESFKIAAEISQEINQSIANAAGRGLGIPDFQHILSDYNGTISSKIGKLRISLQKNFWGKLDVISLYFIPSDGTAATITPTLQALSDQLTSGINAYFKRYPETVDNVSSGIYVAEFQIQ